MNSRMLLTYEDFLIKENFITVEEAKAKLLTTIAERCTTVDDREVLNFFINEGYTNDLFDIATSLDEGFADKFKEMAAKATERAKELGKAAKDKLSAGAKAAVKFGGNIFAALKWVLGKIKDAIMKGWEWVKGQAQSAVDSEKDKIEKELVGRLKNKEKRQDLIDEVGNLGKIGAATADFVGTKIVDAMSKSAEAAANESHEAIFGGMTFEEVFEASFYNAAAETIAEGYSLEEAEKELNELLALDEGGHGDGTSAKTIHIPFISTIMSKLSALPPFNLLHKAEAAIAKGAEKGLNGFSKLASKVAGAPGPFTFPVMAGIVSIVAGYMIEKGVKEGWLSINGLLEKALGVAIPGAGMVYKFMKYGGIALATYGLVKNIIGKYKEDEGHSEEKGEEKTK